MRSRVVVAAVEKGNLFLILALLVWLPLLAQNVPKVDAQAQVKNAADLRGRIEASTKLPFNGMPFAAQRPTTGWESGFVSWVAVDGKGLIYEIQRGDKADPVLVLNHEGKLLRSWGRGDFKIPHSIRIDPAGNVWTVDAGSSVIIKYSALGKKLMTITIGEQPDTGSAFNGATDIAFGPNGRVFITDGYGNARVLEYTADGKRVKQWGKAGSGPGEFSLPHSIQIDQEEKIYIADRENGRIKEFDLDGKFLGEISYLGRIYSLKLVGSVIWASMQPFNEPPGSPGWIVQFDCKTGKMMGHPMFPKRGDCIPWSKCRPANRSPLWATNYYGSREAMA